MKKFLGSLVTFTLLLLVGCNTIEGVGKDITKAGETIENASKKK
jgi:entericidin A